MKQLFTLTIALLSLTSYGQQITSDQWDKEATANKRLLPKYGNLPKTDNEKKADQELLIEVLKKDSTHKKGSDHMIQLGFTYLYRGDLKTAMYRFNQAYLLDSTNTDI